MSKNEGSAIGGLVSLLLFVLIVPACIYGNWIRAGMQAEVYRRQGVQMTQWECYMGMKPIERTINIREDRLSHEARKEGNE